MPGGHAGDARLPPRGPLAAVLPSTPPGHVLYIPQDAGCNKRLRAALPPEPGDLLDLGHLQTWDAALGYLIARTRDEPLLVVLDEFPYLCESDPSLPSTLQARWDHRGEAQLSVVLAGSHVALMDQLVAADDDQLAGEGGGARRHGLPQLGRGDG